MVQNVNYAAGPTTGDRSVDTVQRSGGIDTTPYEVRFTMIGERTNVTGSKRKFEQLIGRG